MRTIPDRTDRTFADPPPGGRPDINDPTRPNPDTPGFRPRPQPDPAIPMENGGGLFGDDGPRGANRPVDEPVERRTYEQPKLNVPATDEPRSTMPETRYRRPSAVARSLPPTALTHLDGKSTWGSSVEPTRVKVHLNLATPVVARRSIDGDRGNVPARADTRLVHNR